jgi:hypothetical protein
LSPGFWNTSATSVRRNARRARFDSFAVPTPRSSTVPSVGRSTRLSTRSSVDLPDPEGPASTVTPRDGTSRLTSDTAVTVPPGVR